MRYSLIIVAFMFTAAIIGSCKKDNISDNPCSADASTVRQITHEKATIKKSGDHFYIIEQGSIDTELDPCNLASEFKVDNLEVTISGDVKTTLRDRVCCTINFIITEISR